MEEQNKTFKFPIGAIFLFVYALLDLSDFFNLFYFDFINFITIAFQLISLLAILGLGVLAIMKKRGLPILIPIAILTLTSLIPFNVLNIPHVVMLACIILFSLDDMNIGGLSKYRNIARTVFIISVILKVASNVVTIQTHHTEPSKALLTIIAPILYTLSMLLIGLWIYNPFKSEKKGADLNVTSDYYISLGKHICLLIFTFGIWQMIWVYKSTKFTNNAIGEEERNPTNKLLLYLFIPFYSIYWTYKTAQRLDIIARNKGLNSDLGTVCLILAIFIGIVPPILMQDKINEIVKNSLNEADNL